MYCSCDIVVHGLIGSILFMKRRKRRGDFYCGSCIVAGDTCEFTDLVYFPVFDFVFFFGGHEAGTAGEALQNEEW